MKMFQEKLPPKERQTFLDQTLESALGKLPEKNTKKEKSFNIELFVDGGSRGNPGKAGGGFAVYQKGALVLKGSEFFGKKTNNQAEYLALRLALRETFTHFGNLPIHCFMDSQLVVEQINGNYKVRSANVKPLHEEITRIKDQFKDFRISHIPRSRNKMADSLANMAMDKG